MLEANNGFGLPEWLSKKQFKKNYPSGEALSYTCVIYRAWKTAKSGASVRIMMTNEIIKPMIAMVLTLNKNSTIPPSRIKPSTRIQIGMPITNECDTAVDPPDFPDIFDNSGDVDGF